MRVQYCHILGASVVYDNGVQGLMIEFIDTYL
jgi:hypothetical protein